MFFFCGACKRLAQAQYQESMESARDEKEKRMPDMVRDLDTNIARLNDQLVQLGPSLEEGVFVDAACFGSPGLVLTELDRVKQRLAAVDTLAKQYSAYQALFGITVYRYGRKKRCLHGPLARALGPPGAMYPGPRFAAKAPG